MKTEDTHTAVKTEDTHTAVKTEDTHTQKQAPARTLTHTQSQECMSVPHPTLPSAACECWAAVVFTVRGEVLRDVVM